MSESGAHRVARQRTDSDAFNTLDQQVFRVRLHDHEHKPIAQAPYLLRIGSSRFTGHADGEAWVDRRIPLLDNECRVYWSRPAEEGEDRPEPQAEEDFEFNLTVYLQFDESDRDETVYRRLHNAGFPFERDDEEARRGAIMAFQQAHPEQSLEPTGELDDATLEALTNVHARAKLREDDSGSEGEAVITDDTPVEEVEAEGVQSDE